MREDHGQQGVIRYFLNSVAEVLVKVRGLLKT